MKTTYFKTIFQKTVDGNVIMIAVLPESAITENMPSICEMQSFMMPQTIYTGIYPQIKINTDTLKDRADLQGLGISGILTQEQWYAKETTYQDILGIAIKKPFKSQ